MAQLSAPRPVLVVAEPGETQDSILSAVTAQELDAEVVTDPEQIGDHWRRAATVLVADQMAERVADRALPHREAVFVVGPAPELLSAWSAPLAARVIQLPGGAAWLGAVLGEADRRSRAPVVAVIGGSGGVGASTLAAALAQLSASGGNPAALVDADALGGGIDLLLGAESVDGWRWPRLNGAEGQLSDLRPYLPVVDGVTVVSMARGGGLDLAREPLAAIVNSLASWHSLVALDTGRAMLPAAREAVRLSNRQLLMVSASVRGVAAAKETIAAYSLEQPELVVRRTRGALPSALVAETLGLTVLAEVPTEALLVGAAERGEPPARGSRRNYRRAVAGLLEQVLSGVVE
jgi:secretion/DNA translocation related CpaE-like protein